MEILLLPIHEANSVHRKSPVSHYIPAPAWSRLEPGDPSHVYSRAPIDAGKDHKVRHFRGQREENDVKRTLTVDSFMAHPETLLPMADNDDPLERFVSVIKFYLSGWHIKPPWVFLSFVIRFYVFTLLLTRNI